jgi:hypothetical protein
MLAASGSAADMTMVVDTALAEVPINKMPLVDDGDFKSIEGAVAYNADALALRWHFVTTAGAYTVTSVTPTDTAGDYDWLDHGDSGVYTIEIPASAGASINNDTEGVGWFTGVATGILPWAGPTIQFSPANVVNSTVNGSDLLDVSTVQVEGTDATDYIEGRTLATANYFDPAADTVATVTAVTDPVLVSDGTGANQIDTSSGGIAHVVLTDTATNLTNAPTSGDFTATMKTSLETAGGNSLATYDPPTRTEATADKAEILATTKQYNNYLHVGSGQTYSTIAAAESPAAAGDLIVVHPGTYSVTAVGKVGVTYWLDYGAILQPADSEADLFGSNAGYAVLGYGRVTMADSGALINLNAASADVRIELDTLVLDSTAGGITQAGAGSQVTLKARRITSTQSGHSIIESSDERCFLEADFIQTAEPLAASITAGGLVDIKCRYVKSTAANFLSATGACVVRFSGVYESTHASSNGINAASGNMIVLDHGSVNTTSGRPHMTIASGGIIQAAPDFGYDAARVTNSGTFVRNAEYPLASADSGATAVARTGADSDTLETLSDEIAGISAGTSPSLLQTTTITGLASQTVFNLTAGSADNDAYNDQLAVIVDAVTAEQKASIAISDYVGATKTVTLSGTPIFNIADGDTIHIIAAPPATVSGTVDANLVQMGGNTQSATDLKDFADAGYDPALNFIEGITAGGMARFITVDTGTTSASAIEGSVVQESKDLFLDGAPDAETVVQNGMTAQGYTAANSAALADLLDGGRLDLIIDSRSSQVSVDDIPTTAEFDARTLAAASYALASTQTTQGTILAKLDASFASSGVFSTGALVNSPVGEGGGLDAAGVRAAVGLASANLDTQLGTKASQTSVDAVKERTDNLPDDPAGVADVTINPVVDVEVVGGGPVEHEQAADINKRRLSRRQAGNLEMNRPWSQGANDTQWHSLDCGPILAGGKFLDGIAAPTVTGGDSKVSVGAYAVLGTEAKVRIATTADAPVGTTATIQLVLTPSVGAQVTIDCEFEVK